MKKFIFSLSSVLIIVFILDFVIGRTLRHFYFREIVGFQYCTTYAMDSTKADILVFGGSRAKYQYVPEFFEDSLKMSFYNTGGEGPAVFYQLAILKSVLKRYTPKVIILDFKGSMEKGGEEGDDCYYRLFQMLPYYEEHKEIRQIIELKDPYEKAKLLSQIYPFNSQIFQIAINNLKNNKGRNIDDKGFFAIEGEWKSKIDTLRNIKPYALDTNKLNALRGFLSIAKQSGAKVFVVYSPVFIKFNDGLQEISVCMNICSSENIPFWNLSQDSVFLNSGHLFREPWHLNPNGARIFSKIIAHKVKEYMDKSERALVGLNSSLR